MHWAEYWLHRTRSRLHLNVGGTSLFAKNLKQVILNWLHQTSNRCKQNFCKRKSVVLGYLNINSIRNKFENLKTILSDSMDILALRESKIDSSFLTSQFLIEGYKTPFRLDIGDKSGGLLVYVKLRSPHVS